MASCTRDEVATTGAAVSEPDEDDERKNGRRRRRRSSAIALCFSPTLHLVESQIFGFRDVERLESVPTADAVYENCWDFARWGEGRGIHAEDATKGEGRRGGLISRMEDVADMLRGL